MSEIGPCAAPFHGRLAQPGRRGGDGCSCCSWRCSFGSNRDSSSAACSRNLLRSTLTGLATFVLVLVITLVWSVLAFLDKQTEAKSQNLKAIVTEKYENPSQMPFAYARNDFRGSAAQEGRLSRRSRTKTPWPGRSTSARSSRAS